MYLALYLFSNSSSLKLLIAGLLQKNPNERFKWREFEASIWCSDVSTTVHGVTILKVKVLE